MRHLVVLLVSGLVLLLALDAPSAAARGDDRLSLGRPRVLASPGTPPVLLRHVEPGATSLETLTWPLPEAGALLVLGLPGRDAAARALADAFDLLPAGGDLEGGYVTVTWHDGRRWIAAVLADDPATLALARSALRVGVPVGASPPKDGEAGPGCEAPAGIGLPAAWRWVRPRARHRILRVDPARGLAAAAEVALAGRATAVLVPSIAKGARGPAGTEEDARAVARLARHGIPVLSEDELGDLEGGLVVLERAASPPLDAAFVRRQRARLGREVLLAEDWNRPWCAPGAPVRIPTPPPPHADDLLAASAGFVVRQGCGDLEILESLQGALGPTEAEPAGAWQAHLLPLLPRRWTSPADFLRRSAEALARKADATPEAVPWMAPLAAQLREDADGIVGPAMLVPYVPASLTTDGHLSEAGWAYAARAAWTASSPGRTPGVPVELLALSDGARLHLAFRTTAPHVLARVRVHDALGGESQVIFASDPDGRGTRPAAGHAVEAPRLAESWGEGGYTGEASFSGAALAGDPYPTRHVQVEVRITVAGEPTAAFARTLVVGR